MEWSRSLGIQYSAQVSYNLPMDMMSSIPHVSTYFKRLSHGRGPARQTSVDPVNMLTFL